jgi:hypothetical protein
MAHLLYNGLCPALELAHAVGASLPGLALVQQLFPKVARHREIEMKRPRQI